MYYKTLIIFNAQDNEYSNIFVMSVNLTGMDKPASLLYSWHLIQIVIRHFYPSNDHVKYIGGFVNDTSRLLLMKCLMIILQSLWRNGHLEYKKLTKTVQGLYCKTLLIWNTRKLDIFQQLSLSLCYASLFQWDGKTC
jgi:hypothetical protein